MKTINQIGKTVLSRIFKSETNNQIGKTVLSRIFKSETKFIAGMNFKRTVSFPDEEFNLTECIFQEESNEDDNEKTIFETKVQIWGMTIGLRNLEIIKDGEMLWDTLWFSDFWQEEIIPSHLIITNSKEYAHYSDGVWNKNDDVYVYRISEKQIQDIYREIDDFVTDHAH